MKIIIETIPHAKQRYPTAGDWQILNTIEGDFVINIFVSDLGDPKQEAAIALHEAYEALTCLFNGVSQTEVDKFDMQFEKDRAAGLRGPTEEPGENALAPYYTQHMQAMSVEYMFAAQVGIDWNAYAEKLENLP